MTAILGHMAGRNVPDTIWVDTFIGSITLAEWRAVAQMPPVSRIEQLITTVVAMREQPKPELPQGHPLGATA